MLSKLNNNYNLTEMLNTINSLDLLNKLLSIFSTGELGLLEQIELLLSNHILNLTNESPIEDFESVIKSLD